MKFFNLTTGSGICTDTPMCTQTHMEMKDFMLSHKSKPTKRTDDRHHTSTLCTSNVLLRQYCGYDLAEVGHKPCIVQPFTTEGTSHG